jgi:hypothetical protein
MAGGGPTPAGNPAPPPHGPFLIPLGAAPGGGYTQEERAPEAVLFFRIYVGIIALACVALLGSGLYQLVDGALGPAADRSRAAGGIVSVAMATLFGTPCLIALLAGRRPWVHTIGTIVIVLTMTTACCIPLAIPMLVVWLKPETRRWYT